MAKLKTFDTGNKAAGMIEIDDSILETPYHRIAVSEVVRQFLAANQQAPKPYQSFFTFSRNSF